MKKNISKTETSNKIRVMVLIITVIVVTFILGFTIVTTILAQTPTVDETPTITQSPTITDPVYVENSTTATIQFGTTLTTPRTHLEYRIIDAQHKTLAENILTQQKSETEETINLPTETTTLSILVRLKDTITETPWETVYTTTTNTIPPPTTEPSPDTTGTINEDFYETPWATQTITTQQTLNQAIEVAYNATPANPAGYCVYANNNNVNVGEIVPPLPAQMNPYHLNYHTYQLDENTYNIQYLWCE